MIFIFRIWGPRQPRPLEGQTAYPVGIHDLYRFLAVKLKIKFQWQPSKWIMRVLVD